MSDELLKTTEPLVIVGESRSGVSESTAKGIAGTMSKWELMKQGMTGDQAEAELKRRTEAGE